VTAARDFLIAVVALAVWAGSLYVWPFGPCGRCNGTGLNRGSNARRFGTCRRCGGTRRVQRRGSRTVHRIAWAIRGETLRALQRRRDRKLAERTAHPRNLADKDH
jgi:hypothetical protein